MKTWEQRVRDLESDGLPRSDAQAVVDAEDRRAAQPQRNPLDGLIAYTEEYMLAVELWVERHLRGESVRNDTAKMQAARRRLRHALGQIKEAIGQ